MSSSTSSSRFASSRYLALFGAVFGALLLGTAALNVLVDPFGLTGSLGVARLRPLESERGSRTYKANRVLRNEVSVLFLGSSRSEVGFDPEYPGLKGAAAYNATLRGTTFYETLRMYRLARSHANLSRVVLGADFAMFHGRRLSDGDFDQSRLNETLAPLPYALEKFTSLRAVGASLETLENFRQGQRSLYTEAGFRSGVQKHRRDSPRELFEATITGYLQKRRRFAGFSYGEDHLERFREIVAMTQEDGVDLVVLIPPVHALHLETIRAAGLWPVFERWKRDLAASLAGTEFPLYDFTGYDAFTTEPVPLQGGADAAMRWWWESAHFRRALGDRVLDRALATRAGAPLPPWFGPRLAMGNLDAHLERIEAARRAWIERSPNQVRWFRRVAGSSPGLE